ncbi:MAG TPA: 2-oxo acid dehydrogenase subunit E2 [Pseudomonadota bacterium]|jgi:pyruvate dehydrogenase E2 component (dihydrolipoamide acetyltransferase)|nr:2-oxo acid dehydrogenase subunit E2 [Pseudomonadota bacterium]
MANMSVRRKLAIASYSAPREGNIYGKLVVDATPGLSYLDDLRKKTGEKVSMTHLVGRAVAEALKQAPTLNGRIVLGSFEPFPTVDISFLVALEDGSDLARAKVCEADKKSVAEIARELSEKSTKLRASADPAYEKSKQAIRMLPTWLLKPLLHTTGFLASSLGLSIPALGVEPFPFGSCIITSVGMFGLEEGFVPPTPFTRVPVYILVGAVKERPAVVDGAVSIQKQLTLTATIDHRFIDGAQLSVLAKVVKHVLENPWQLDAPQKDQTAK